MELFDYIKNLLYPTDWYKIAQTFEDYQSKNAQPVLETIYNNRINGLSKRRTDIESLLTQDPDNLKLQEDLNKNTQLLAQTKEEFIEEWFIPNFKRSISSKFQTVISFVSQDQIDNVIQTFVEMPEETLEKIKGKKFKDINDLKSQLQIIPQIVLSQEDQKDFESVPEYFKQWVKENGYKSNPEYPIKKLMPFLLSQQSMFERCTQERLFKKYENFVAEIKTAQKENAHLIPMVLSSTNPEIDQLMYDEPNELQDGVVNERIVLTDAMIERFEPSVAATIRNLNNGGVYCHQLRTVREMMAEGCSRSICIGRAEQGYLEAAKQGSSEFYSLRTSQDNILASIQVSERDGVFKLNQIKGAQNGGLVLSARPFAMQWVLNHKLVIAGDFDKVAAEEFVGNDEFGINYTLNFSKSDSDISKLISLKIDDEQFLREQIRNTQNTKVMRTIYGSENINDDIRTDIIFNPNMTSNFLEMIIMSIVSNRNNGETRLLKINANFDAVLRSPGLNSILFSELINHPDLFPIQEYIDQIMANEKIEKISLKKFIQGTTLTPQQIAFIIENTQHSSNIQHLIARYNITKEYFFKILNEESNESLISYIVENYTLSKEEVLRLLDDPNCVRTHMHEIITKNHDIIKIPEVLFKILGHPLTSWSIIEDIEDIAECVELIGQNTKMILDNPQANPNVIEYVQEHYSIDFDSIQKIIRNPDTYTKTLFSLLKQENNTPETIFNILTHRNFVLPQSLTNVDKIKDELKGFSAKGLITPELLNNVVKHPNVSLTTVYAIMDITKLDEESIFQIINNKNLTGRILFFQCVRTQKISQRILDILINLDFFVNNEEFQESIVKKNELTQDQIRKILSTKGMTAFTIHKLEEKPLDDDNIMRMLSHPHCAKNAAMRLLRDKQLTPEFLNQLVQKNIKASTVEYLVSRNLIDAKMINVLLNKKTIINRKHSDNAYVINKLVKYPMSQQSIQSVLSSPNILTDTLNTIVKNQKIRRKDVMAIANNKAANYSTIDLLNQKFPFSQEEIKQFFSNPEYIDFFSARKLMNQKTIFEYLTMVKPSYDTHNIFENISKYQNLHKKNIDIILANQPFLSQQTLINLTTQQKLSDKNIKTLLTYPHTNESLIKTVVSNYPQSIQYVRQLIPSGKVGRSALIQWCKNVDQITSKEVNTIFKKYFYLQNIFPIIIQKARLDKSQIDFILTRCNKETLRSLITYQELDKKQISSIISNANCDGTILTLLKQKKLFNMEVVEEDLDKCNNSVLNSIVKRKTLTPEQHLKIMSNPKIYPAQLSAIIYSPTFNADYIVKNAKEILKGLNAESNVLRYLSDKPLSDSNCILLLKNQNITWDGLNNLIKNPSFNQKVVLQHCDRILNNNKCSFCVLEFLSRNTTFLPETQIKFLNQQGCSNDIAHLVIKDNDYALNNLGAILKKGVNKEMFNWLLSLFRNNNKPDLPKEGVFEFLKNQNLSAFPVFVAQYLGAEYINEHFDELSENRPMPKYLIRNLISYAEDDMLLKLCQSPYCSNDEINNIVFHQKQYFVIQNYESILRSRTCSDTMASYLIRNQEDKEITTNSQKDIINNPNVKSETLSDLIRIRNLTPETRAWILEKGYGKQLEEAENWYQRYRQE